MRRGIADAGWAGLLDKLRSKAAEAGAKLEDRPTRKVKPSRRCSACGFELARDQNACRNRMRLAFEGAWWGRQDRPGTGLEPPSEKALAPAQGE